LWLACDGEGKVVGLAWLTSLIEPITWSTIRYIGLQNDITYPRSKIQNL